MAKKTQTQSSFSFKSEAQIDVGLWQGGECSVKDIGFCQYDYGGTKKAKDFRSGQLPYVLLAVFQHAEGTYEQPYTIGDGWELPDVKDDLTGTIIPTKGQTGFPKSTNAAYFFNSLKDAGYDLGELDGEDGVKALVGKGLVVKREAQPDRGTNRDRDRGRSSDRGGDRGEAREATFLLVRELLEEKVAAKAKATSKRTAKSAVADEDDEIPFKRGPKGKPNGAASLEDEATAALTEVLEHADGQKSLDDIEEAVFTHLRKHPHKKDIAEVCADEDFLAGIEGITFNKKKGVIALEA